MKFRIHVHAIVVMTCFAVSVCQTPGRRIAIERGFYYWKNTTYSFDSAELSYLKNLRTQKLYVKFFEVEEDPVFFAAPIAKSILRISDYSSDYERKEDSALSVVMEHLEIIPVVFVKNEVLRSATHGSLDTLADNIDFLVTKYLCERMSSYCLNKELHIDCDWTAKTKDNYFYLLNAIKKVSGVTLSCTLRLYPYKYPELMGVPPVDKVTLMCYNLTSPLENENGNSILDNAELESYLKNAKEYPIHMDVALPVFSWMHVYQNDEFAGIISSNEIDMNYDLKEIKPMWYEVQNDKEIGNIFLREGDKIKLEEVSDKTIEGAISLIKEYVSFDDTITVTLFHLDSDNLKKYSDEALSGFYTGFHKL